MKCLICQVLEQDINREKRKFDKQLKVWTRNKMFSKTEAAI